MAIRTDVYLEKFPSVKKSKKKYFVFRIFNDKHYPELCSGRFTSKTTAEEGLKKFLLGDQTSIFGNLGRFDKR